MDPLHEGEEGGPVVPPVAGQVGGRWVLAAAQLQRHLQRVAVHVVKVLQPGLNIQQHDEKVAFYTQIKNCLHFSLQTPISLRNCELNIPCLHAPGDVIPLGAVGHAAGEVVSGGAGHAPGHLAVLVSVGVSQVAERRVIGSSRVIT